MSESPLSWIVMAVLLAFGIHTWVVYTTVRLLTTGRGMFERKHGDREAQRESPRIVGGGFER